MPPQQTNTTSETVREGAGFGLDLPIALLKRYWRAFRDRRQGLRVALQDLSDRELMDIGLTRGEIDCIAPQRAIDKLRDSTTHLWGGGVM